VAEFLFADEHGSGHALVPNLAEYGRHLHYAGGWPPPVPKDVVLFGAHTREHGSVRRQRDAGIDRLRNPGASAFGSQFLTGISLRLIAAGLPPSMLMMKTCRGNGVAVMV
jgi:hypothetical protein